MSDTTAALSYIVVEFSRPDQIQEGFDRLAALAEAGAMQIADVEFIHSIQGIPSTIPAHQVHPALTGYDALDTRMLVQSDLDVVADAIPVGSMAAVVLYSGAPILPALADWSRDGASVVLEGTGETGGINLLGGQP
ncbi:MAG: hypothetical protein ACOYBX_06225 [Mycobacterium sp.]|jgi:hypothetical protein